MSTQDFSTAVSVDKVTSYRNTDNSVYRVIESIFPDMAYEAGSGVDATVTVSVKLKLSSKFTVDVQLQAAGVTAYINNKSTSGFDIVLKPAASTTLAAGAMDVVVNSFENYQ